MYIQAVAIVKYLDENQLRAITGKKVDEMGLGKVCVCVFFVLFFVFLFFFKLKHDDI